MTISGPDARVLSQTKELDYKAIGFRCGLEIHQQLATGKLFSRLPSEVLDPDEIAARTTGEVVRTLRATGSETGAIDAAAQAEAKRQRRFRYLAIEGLTSLVELDEEPPRPMDQDALDVALTFAAMLDARFVDEVHVMRKTVIDGSNTSGFQRTALVATGGRIPNAPDHAGDAQVGSWTIAVEEDSARPVEAGSPAAKAGTSTYTLDRLGIPLIEIATAPDIRDPAHAQRVAARLGGILRSITGPDGASRVKRGLGTIRQDLNVSVAVGERVEIKGCQDLRAVPRVIEEECRRQLWMHHVLGELRARGFDAQAIGKPSDVSAAFAATGAKSVKDALGKGQVVLGLRLPHWNGLLRGATKDGPRLGRELADHAKVAAGVKGIFHSDELPAYGIAEAEVAAVRAALGCQSEDAFVLCVEAPAVARRALEAARDRAAQAAVGPVSEVRNAMPDDSTRYLRPMPGAARMYPETDVPPIRIDAGRAAVIRATLPALPERRVQQLVATHRLSADVARQLVDAGEDAALGQLVAGGADASLAARVLLQVLPPLAHATRVRALVPEVLAAQRTQGFAKEALPDVLAALDADANLGVAAAVAKAAGSNVGAAEVDAVCRAAVAERLEFVRQRGEAAIGPLMGPVMAQLRGKADGAVISARLKAAVADALR